MLTQNVVNQAIHDFTDDVLPFETLSKHPMIYHRVVSGIAYQACCGHQSIVSQQTFDTYLTNINVDADFGTLMESLFLNWFVSIDCFETNFISIDTIYFSITQLTASPTSPNTNLLHNCHNAEVEMKEALKDREK